MGALSGLYRHLTASGRVMPDFIIVGAQKAGTTSLFSYLAQHPQLHPSSKKEVHFFSDGKRAGVDRFGRGERWYRAHFPRRETLRDGDRAFEASPSYLFHPLAPERIHRMVPTARLIVMLRNPVDRAISHYFHQRRKGRETLPILEALQAEEERLAPALAREDYRDPVFRQFSYKSRGVYHEQIRRYLEYFPPEQLLIFDADDLFTCPEATLVRVWDFVGVEEAFEGLDLSPRNVGSNRQRVDEDVRTYLEDWFRPHNRALEELLGRDFDW